MALTEAYLVTTKNLEEFFNSIQSARAPDQFTHTFLKNLGFTSSNDRLYIRLLKALGFIDDSGVPTERYYRFLDQTQARAVLAEAIEEAYEDLFVLNNEAFLLSKDEVKNKLRTLTQGKKSDNVINWMVNTFVALAQYADWEGLDALRETELEGSSAPDEAETSTTPNGQTEKRLPFQHRRQTHLHYNIQIHLPESRDPAVYDAIFQSLRKHLDL